MLGNHLGLLMHDHFLKVLFAGEGRVLRPVRRLVPSWILMDKRRAHSIFALCEVFFSLFCFGHFEGRLLAGHVVEEAAKGPDVDLEIKRLFPKDFWARVDGGTNFRDKDRFALVVCHRY
jgi:hypothetical protein